MSGESDHDRDGTAGTGAEIEGEGVSDAIEEPPNRAAELVDELPVVARLVVEIRSDGRRTIARGAMEDLDAGVEVAVEAKGDTPLGLAWALARTVFSMPSLARATARGLLERRTKKPR